jgi:glycosyltransferase involved in cell wall biosynthesis
MDKSIFIVVPAYNEASAIRSTIEELTDCGCSIVVVDDGSVDNTWSILKDEPLYAVRHPINLGQGAALQTGMTFALELGAKVIVHFDADGQHTAMDINSIVEPILSGHADVVLGSRFLRKADRAIVPPSRRLLLKLAVLFNGCLTGIWLTDAHNGFRALSRSAAQKIMIRENHFAHASDILTQIRRHRLRYVERPTRITYSTYSLGKGQRAWNAFNIVIDLFLGRIFK